MDQRKRLFSVTIKDCRVEAIASTKGGGGQHKNRRHTAIRITHPPSGAVGYSADERDQLQNKRTAFIRMSETKEFKNWLKVRIAQACGQPSVDDQVEEMMRPENLKVEVRSKETGQWTTVGVDGLEHGA